MRETAGPAGQSESGVFSCSVDCDDGYDSVDKSIQSSRHVDVFKVWLMWRAKGPQGYEAQIEQLMDLSRYNSHLTFATFEKVFYAQKHLAT